MRTQVYKIYSKCLTFFYNNVNGDNWLDNELNIYLKPLDNDTTKIKNYLDTKDPETQEVLSTTIEYLKKIKEFIEDLIECYEIAEEDPSNLFQKDLTENSKLSDLAKSEISRARSDVSSARARSQTAQSVMDSEEVLRAPSTTRNYQTAADEDEEEEEDVQEARGRKLKRNKISKKVNVSKKTVKGGNNSNYHVIRF